jgi:membrane-associated phospholipid phosphatase
MNRRQLLYSVLIAVVLTLLGIFFFDQPIAAFVQHVGGRQSVILQEGTHWLEIVTGQTIDRYLLTYVLLGLSALLFISKASRPIAWILLFVGAAQVATRLAGGVLKNVFERLRPFQVIEAGNWDWKFFSGHGNSFPSGHSAFFWGLFFPLAYLFPRYRLPLLIVPIFITIARPGVNDHWCSDVIASAGLSAFITFVFIWLFRMRPAQRNAPNAVAIDDTRADRV